MTSRFHAVVSVATITILLIAQPVAASQSAKLVPDAKVRMAALFAAFDSPNSPGCAYAVRRNGKLIAQRAFGSADVAKGRTLKANIPMNIGSVSKSFTGAAILTLIRAGKIKTTDTIAQHFPDLPDWAKTVTVADLIHMRSGIPDFLERPSDGADR